MENPSYFDVMGIPLSSGRGFTSSDGADASPVAIVDQWLAQKYNWHYPQQGWREILWRDLKGIELVQAT